MKRNIRATMERLGIDKEITLLIKQLWKHGYRTKYSCQGGGSNDNNHSSSPYVAVERNTGDGWFEQNSLSYGLLKTDSLRACCLSRKVEDPSATFCRDCGAGIRNLITYRGFERAF